MMLVAVNIFALDRESRKACLLGWRSMEKEGLILPNLIFKKKLIA